MSTSVTATDIDVRLRTEIADWAGTPHVLGGTSLRGLDCSAFVQRVYSNVFDLELPRTTRDQVRVGAPVSRRQLRLGDLVFFKPPTAARHVGIYLEDGQFAHVSSSQGVMISGLDENYWDRAYWTSRRILPETVLRATAINDTVAEESQNSPLESDRSEPALPRQTRVGW